MLKGRVEMKEAFKKNREKLLNRIEMFSAAVIFAGKAPYKRGDERYPFAPDRNFYYLTGIDREDCILFMAKTRTGLLLSMASAVAVVSMTARPRDRTSL